MSSFIIYPTNSLTIIIHIAPGSPSKPTKMLVIKLIPICKFILAPKRFINQITIPPSIEFKTSFKTFFIGTIKILPNINKKQIQAK